MCMLPQIFYVFFEHTAIYCALRPPQTTIPPKKRSGKARRHQSAVAVRLSGSALPFSSRRVISGEQNTRIGKELVPVPRLTYTCCPSTLPA